MSAVPALFEYSGFDPRNIGGCSLWLDAADPATVTLSGSNVTRWKDKSGNRYDATSVNNPTFSTASNGIEFVSASSQYFNLPDGVYPSSNSSYSYFYIFTPKTTTSGQTFTAGGTISASSADFGKYCALRTGDAGTGTLQAYWFSFDLQTSNTFSTNVKNFAATYYTSGGSRSVWINFAQGASDTPGTRSQTPNNNRIGASGVSTISDYLNAFLHEIIVYNTAVSTSERQHIEGYLAWKWGLTSSLPATHPYKSVPLSARPFRPLDIAGCGLWLDAADPSSLTLSGSNVTTWLDKSGNARNATGVSSPTYSVPSVVFGGSSYFTLNLDFLFGVNHYAFIVLSNTNFTNIYGAITSNAGGQSLHVGFSASNAYRMNLWTNSFQPAITSNYRSGQTNLLSFVWSNVASKTIFANGALEATSNQAAQVSLMAGGGTIGNAVGQGIYTGVINEIVIFAGVTLTPSQRERVEGYLAWKWGLQPFLAPLTITSPTQVSGLAFWLDATDESSFTFSSGSNISQWRDKVLNAVGTAVSSPVRVQSGINGYPSVTFNGSSQYINFGNLINLGTSNFSVFAVCQFDTSANGGVVGKTSFRSNSARWALLRSSGDGGMRMLIQGGTTVAAATYADTSTLPRILTGQWNRAVVSILENGIQRATSNFANTTSLSNTDPLYVGAHPNSNATGPQTGLFFNGRIGEILVYQVPMTTAVREQVETYLGTKWGITNIAGNHSFWPFPPLQPLFTPLEIPNCSAWYDGADSTTVTLVSSRVSQWNDKSGNAYNATQATASNRPSYSNNGIVFDRGVSGAMHLEISVPYSASHSIFMVATTSSASQTYYIGRAQTSGGGPTFIANFTGSSLEYFNNTNRATFTASPSGTFLVSYTQASAGRILGFYNGSSSFDIVQSDTANPSVAWSTIGNAHLTVYTNTVTGSIYELIFYGATLTGQQRQRVEGYLAHKWGLQGSLPTTHPYRRFKP